MSYEAPLRCERCFAVIVKKPKAKTPKYCTGCRQAQQESYKNNLKQNRQRIIRDN